MNGGKALKLCLVVQLYAVLVAGMAACSSVAGDEQQTEGKLDVVAPAEASVSDSILAWAENVIAGQCMTAQGFNFSVAAPSDSQDSPVDNYGQLYGSDDAGRAQLEGYGINAEFHAASSPVPDPNRSYLASLSPSDRARFDQAYFGPDSAAIEVDAGASTISVGSEGCLAEARIRLYGGIAEWAPLDVWVTGLDSEIHDLVIRDAEYLVLLGRWQECMRQRKFPTASPGESRERVAQTAGRLGPLDAVRVERETAVADASCNRTSGLRVGAAKLHASQARKILDRESARFAEYSGRRERALGMARELMSKFSERPSPG